MDIKTVNIDKILSNTKNIIPIKLNGKMIGNGLVVNNEIHCQLWDEDTHKSLLKNNKISISMEVR